MLKLEQILGDLIRLPTVNPPGNEGLVAGYLKGICDRAGIEHEIIEGEKGRGNFLARLGPESEPRRLLFLAHSDVVPAGEGWQYAPFSGERRGDLIYGRGARDCKGLLAAELFALLRLAREGISLKGTLLLAATADEEQGGGCGVRYLLEHCPQKLQADFVINEGAEEPIILNGRTFYFIQAGEKGTAWSKLYTRGTACHGSVPMLGDNAVVKMAAGLHALGGYRAEIKLIPEVQYLLQGLARAAGMEATVSVENVDAVLEKLAVHTGGLAENLRAMTRMTVSPNMVQGGIKTNIVPDYCEASLDIRVLPGQDRDYVRCELDRYAGRGVEIDTAHYYPPTFTPASSPYYRLVEKVTGQVSGQDITCLPHISPGATDSRFLRNAGIPCWGIAPMVPGIDPEGRNTLHSKDERIDVPSLYRQAEFCYALARAYLGG